MGRPKKYPEELIQRGIRLALESGRPVAFVARDLGISPDALRHHVRLVRSTANAEGADPLTGRQLEELHRLRRENFELRRTNEILKSASVFFARELDLDRPR
jgi:transposase